MHTRSQSRIAACAAGLLLVGATWAHLGARATAPAPLAIDTARVTIAGTSNLHDFSATTEKVRVVRADAPALAASHAWDDALKPGGIATFEVAIPSTSLSSDKDGLNKNMYKALKAQEFPDITFRLTRIDAGAAGTPRAVGTLKIAGVEREIAFDVKVQRKDACLTVTGEVGLLMTDYGITPPKAMLGVLKTNPKVTVSFETVLSIPAA